MTQSLAIAAVLPLLALGFADSAHAQAQLPSPNSPPGFFAMATESEAESELLSQGIIVDLKDGTSDAEVADLERTYGVPLRPSSAWSRTHTRLEVGRVLASLRASLLERLAKDPRVEGAEPISLVHVHFVPNDPLYETKQWHLKRVGAERSWAYGCGQGVTVAVIDTGIACYSEGSFSKGTDLAKTRCGGGYDFVNDRVQASDDHGHGTHVAGTIAQTTNNGLGVAGLAPCVTLMPVKVLSGRGWGRTDHVADGIRFAADHGAQVINLSLGGSTSSRILQSAVEYARAKGVVVVAAAGNSGKSVGYPAAYKGVIAVSATDQNDKIAWFSSRGPEVSLAAPGVAVTQQTICQGGKGGCEIFGTFNGTSMASPHVAGAAALLVGMGVTDPDAVMRVLANAATPKDDPKLYGAGVLDVGKAAKTVHGSRTVIALGALLGVLLLVAAKIRSRGGSMSRSPFAWLGALVASVGLAPFLPALDVAPRAGALRPVVEMLSRPMGEWDLLVSAGIHRWHLLASALPAMVMVALFFGVKPLRRLTGGVALGSAANLVAVAWLGHATFVGGPVLLWVWCATHALICVWIARFALDEKEA